MSQYNVGSMGTPGAFPVETLTGNSGGAVPPTAGNINLIGSGGVTVTGDPGTSTLTISGSAGVDSLTGTANQVLVNGTTGTPETGALTLTLPQSIATTSNVQFGSLGLGVAASGTTGRLQTTGITKLGSSSAFGSIASHEFVWVSAVGSFITTYLTGTMTNVSGGGAQAGLQIQTTFASSSGGLTNVDAFYFNGTYSLAANLAAATCFRGNPAFGAGGGLTLTDFSVFRSTNQASGGFTGTITNFYGYYAEALTLGTNRYAARFIAPSAGTIAIACYTDNLSAGYNVTPPALGAIISGAVGIGTNGPQNKLDVAGSLALGAYGGVNTAPTNGMIISGAVGFGVNSVSARFHLNSPSSSTANNYASYNSGEIISTQTNFSAAWATDTFISPSNALTIGASILLFPKFNPAGSITNACGIYIETGSTAGTITNGYGIYVQNPTYGTNKYAAFFGGAVGIGTAAPNAASALEVSSTTQGVRFPNMTTVQKDAMADVAGMVVFDTDLGKLCVNDGGNWQTITSS